MSPEQRSAIYALTAATAPLLVAVGVVVESDVPLILAAADAFLGCVVAFWNRPTKAG